MPKPNDNWKAYAALIVGILILGFSAILTRWADAPVPPRCGGCPRWPCCCGAGGGRIWMKELKGDDSPRPSELRIDEAVDLGGIDFFVVACPKDVTMYEDAIKTSGHQGEIELRELSELVYESLALA